MYEVSSIFASVSSLGSTETYANHGLLWGWWAIRSWRSTGNASAPSTSSWNVSWELKWRRAMAMQGCHAGLPCSLSCWVVVGYSLDSSVMEDIMDMMDVIWARIVGWWLRMATDNGWFMVIGKRLMFAKVPPFSPQKTKGKGLTMLCWWHFDAESFSCCEIVV